LPEAPSAAGTWRPYLCHCLSGADTTRNIPRQILNVETPRLALQLLRREISVGICQPVQNTEHQKQDKKNALLVCPRKEVEHVKERLHVKLRVYCGGTQQRIGCLRIVRCRGERVSWNIVFWPEMGLLVTAWSR
jgi:hypothetical protein